MHYSLMRQFVKIVRVNCDLLGLYNANSLFDLF